MDEMLEAAMTPSGILHQDSFAKAMTDDIKLYDISSEARYSTNYDDVFLTRNHHEVADWSQDEENTSMTSEAIDLRKSISKTLKRRFTFPAIDNTAGTYRSKTLMVALWASFTVTWFGAYYSQQDDDFRGACAEFPFVYNATWDEQSGAIACTAVISIFRWLVISLWVG